MTEQNTTTPDKQYTLHPGKNGSTGKWWKKPVVILPVAAFVLGSALGLGATPKPVVKEVPGPERIVEKPVEKIVTKTVTPPECLKAMDLYEQVVDYSSEALGYTKEAMLAASRLDAAGIREQDAKMGELTPKIQAVTTPLLAAKASCRAAGS